MTSPHLDLRWLKQKVSIEQVLSHCGAIELLTRKGNRLVGPCPLHGGDNPRAFVVDLEKSCWYCFTRCATGGDIVELVCRLGSFDVREAATYLASLAGQQQTAPLSRPRPHPSTPMATFRPFTRRLPLDPNAPLLAQKGIVPLTARRFEAGLYHGRGFLEGCLGVRLHSRDGSPLGYIGRRLDGQQILRLGKWKMPPRLPKSRLLYNLHRLGPPFPSPLILVEDPWSVMRLSQLGLSAVALLGCSMSPHQHRLLSALPKLLVMLDGDDAGRAASKRITEALRARASVREVLLPHGLDPDDLPDETLESLVRPFFLL